MSSQVSNNVHTRNVFIGYNSVSDIDCRHHAISSERKRLSGTHLNHLGVPVKTKAMSSANVDPAALKKSLEGFDISGFSRPSLAVLIALMEASSSDVLAQADMQASFTRLARTMTEEVSGEIAKQGHTALAQGILCGALSLVGGIVSGLSQLKSSSLSQKALTAADNERAILNASAQKWATSSIALRTAGEGLNVMGSGFTRNIELGFSSEQKKMEQDTHVSNTLTETTNQEKEKVKEYKEQILRIIQGILDDQKQATDAAAMKC